MTRTRTTTEALRRVLDSFASDLHVALPGTVRSYDAATQTAEIELGVRRVLPAADEEQDEDTSEALPILPSVPVAWPRAGGFFLHWPMAAGDTVLVVFSESDLNAWRESGGVVDPGVALRHALSGAVCHPGLSTRANPIADADGTHGRIGNDGGVYIEFQPAEIRAGGAYTLAKRDQLATHLQAIETNLDTIATAAGAVNLYDFGVLDGIDPIATAVLKGS